MPRFEDGPALSPEELSDLLTKGNPVDRAASTSRFTSVSAQVVRLGDVQVRAARRLDETLGRVLEYRVDGRALTKESERAVTKAIADFASEVVDAYAVRLGRELALSSQSAGRSISRRLVERGYAPPRPGTVERLARDVSRENVTRFGKTPAQRLDDMEARAAQRVWRAITKELGGAPRSRVDRAAAARAAVRDVVSAGTGVRAAIGGSIRRDMDRLLVSEAGARTRETERQVMLTAGVGFAWWRLSATHPPYKKLEICEFYASRVLEGIETRLVAAGVEPASVDLDGLLPLDSVPEHPHPFCRCWLEPLSNRG